jgi:PKD repeat protein
MKRTLSAIVAAIAMVAAVAIGAGQASAQVAAPAANPGGPYSGATGNAIQFSGTLSAGTGLAFQWNFGDGTAATGVVASHAYATPGIYTVTLTVVDGFGQMASASTTATITATGLTSGTCMMVIGDQDGQRVVYVPSPFGQTCAVSGTSLIPGTATACVMTAAGTVACGTTTPGQIVNGTVISGAGLPWWMYQNSYPYGLYFTP